MSFVLNILLGLCDQMTDARCSRCMEKKVGVADIIQAGGLGDRYQVEQIFYLLSVKRDSSFYFSSK